MVSENFHGRFRVRVVGGLEFQAGNAEFGEEVFEEFHEAAEGEAEICDDAFYLMELG